MDADGAPAIIALTRISSVGRRMRVAIGVAAREGFIDFIVQQNRRKVLEARFILCGIDVVAPSGAAPVIQCVENRHRAVGDSYVIEVWSVEHLRRAARISRHMCKTRERRTLRTPSVVLSAASVL